MYKYCDGLTDAFTVRLLEKIIKLKCEYSLSVAVRLCREIFSLNRLRNDCFISMPLLLQAFISMPLLLEPICIYERPVFFSSPEPKAHK